MVSGELIILEWNLENSVDASRLTVLIFVRSLNRQPYDAMPTVTAARIVVRFLFRYQIWPLSVRLYV